MSIGTTNLSMYAIATELNYSGSGLSHISMVNELYDSSQLSYNSHGGSYHNLGMTMNLANTFQSAIEAPYSAGGNMALKQWAGYDHDIGVNLNYIINNGSGYDVNVKLYLETSPSYGGYFNFFTGMVPMNNSGNVNVANYNTTSAAFSNYYSGGGYWISADISLLMPPAGRPVNMSVTSAVDTDNKGSGIPRFNYTADGTPGGPWNLDPNTGGSNFLGILASGDNSSPFPTDGISWNKRTAIIIDIT
jgi:hypothetical protein